MPFEAFDTNSIDQGTQTNQNQPDYVGKIPVLGGLMKAFFPTTANDYDKGIQNTSSFLNKVTGGRIGTQIPQDQALKNFQDVQSNTQGQLGGVLPSKSLMEMGSFLMPLGAESRLVRAGLGGAAGLARGLSQENANPVSVAENTVTGAGSNVVLPDLLQGLAKGLGRASLGPGGWMLPEINKASDNNIMGSAGKIIGENPKTGNSNLWDWTAPIRQKVQDLLAQSDNHMTKNEFINIVNKTAENAKLGTEGQDAAKTYVTKLLSKVDDRLLGRFNKVADEIPTNVGEAANKVPDMGPTVVGAPPGTPGPGTSVRTGPRLNSKSFTPGEGANFRPAMGKAASEAERLYTNTAGDVAKGTTTGTGGVNQETMDAIQKGTHPAPLTLWHDVLGQIQEDASWAKKTVSPVGKFARSLYQNLSQELASRSGDSKQYNALNGLLGASSKIGSNLKKGFGVNENTVKNLLPLLFAGSTKIGNPLGMLEAIPEFLATHASTATPLSAAASNPTVQSGAVKTLQSMFGELFRNKQGQ